MVDIKGLDKARVLKALYDYADNQGTGRFERCRTTVTVEVCKSALERSWKIECAFGLFLKVDLSGDEFDESEYDKIHGEGAAQRAVDCVRARMQDSGAADKDADGGKKELTMAEKMEQTRAAIEKILKTLDEIPPDMYAATCMVLKTAMPGPSLSNLLVPPFPFGGRFG